jgi:hypothetical protein
VNKKINMHRNGQESFISKEDIYINHRQNINAVTEFHNYNLAQDILLSIYTLMV